MAELGLKFEENDLKDMLDLSSDLIQVVDDKGKFVYVNGTWKEKLEYLDEDVKNLYLQDIIHPKSADNFQKIYKQIRAGENNVLVEAIFISKTGKSIYVEGMLNCCFNENGGSIGSKGILRDVTFKKNHEQEVSTYQRQLQEKTQMEKLLFEISIDFINVREDDFAKIVNKNLGKIGRFVAADRVYILKYSFIDGVCNNIYEWCENGVGSRIDKLQGISLADISYWVNNQMNSKVVSIPNVIEMSLDNRVREILESQGIKSIVALPIIFNENCYGFIGFDYVGKQQIYSELEQQILSAFGRIFLGALQRIKLEKELLDSETKCRALINNVPGAVFRCKNDGHWTMEYINEEIEKITGFSADDFINNKERSYASIIHDTDRILIYQKVQESIVKKKPYAIDYRVINKDGTAIWIHENAQGVFDSKGKLVYVIGIITDITTRIKMEKNLRQSEARKTALLESMQELVLVLDTKLFFQECYTPKSDLLYVKPEMILGRHIDDIDFPELALGMFKRKLENTLLSGEPDRVEYYLDLPHGRYWFDAQITVVRGKGEAKEGVLCVIRDITSRIKMENALRRSQKKYRSLVENINEIVYVIDTKAKIKYISPNIENISGYTVDEMKGANFIEFVYQEDREERMNEFRRALLGNNKASEYRFLTKSKRIIWVSTKANPVIKNGKVIGIQGLLYDITYRKQMEELLKIEKEQFKTTLLSVGDGVISTDNHGNIVVINKIAEQLTAWTREEAEGKALEEVFNIINEFTRERCENPVNKVLNTGDIIELTNHTILIAKDGTERPIEDIAAPIKDEEGRINGVVLVFRDFTEKKEKQAKIEYLSFHDQLTGVYNRRFFAEELTRIDTERNLPLTLIMADVNGLKLANDAFGHLMGDEILREAAELLKKACRSDDIVARIGGDEFIMLLPQTNAREAECFVNRIKKALSDIKIDSIELSISFGWVTKNEANEKMEEIYKQAEDYMYRHKLYESPSMRSNTIKTIIQTMFEKIPGEKEHSERVSKICEKIGIELGYNSDKIAELKTAGLMHDIGKITLDEALLHKLGKFDISEWVEVKRHPETGYRILSEVNEMAKLAEYTLAHHENWDGTGYPKGLKGKEIPIQARIIRVADAYDAMTSDRCYRKSLSKAAALEELKINAGTQFDPEIVGVFIEKVCLGPLL